MKAVIIDDEPILAEAIEILLQKSFPEIEVAGKAGSVSNAVQLINKINPDLILLDINIMEGTGFDVIDQINELKAKVIFITAYDEHALKAFKYDAIDYLVKPLDPDEFYSSVKKFMANRPQQTDISSIMNFVKKQKSPKIFLNSASEIIPVFINDILYVEAEGNYCYVKMEQGKKILTTKKLKTYLELLDDNIFTRINHSVIINTTKIEKYIKGNGGEVIMSGSEKFTVSRRRKPYLLEFLS